MHQICSLHDKSLLKNIKNVKYNWTEICPTPKVTMSFVEQETSCCQKKLKALPVPGNTPVWHRLLLVSPVSMETQNLHPLHPPLPKWCACYIRLRSKPSFWYPTKHQRRSNVAPTPARSWRKRQGKRSRRSSISRGLTLVTSWLR